MRIQMWCLCAAITLLVVSCGGSGNRNPVEPTGSDQSVTLVPSHSQAASESNRYLWGMWEVRVAADHQSVEIVPRRATEMHLNAVRLLEVAPCTDCLTIGNIKACGPYEVKADLTLRHPFPGLLRYTAFDVRGIFISGADYMFPEGLRRIAWGETCPRMTLHDGYTSLFNPTEFPETTPPAFGYIQGKYATGGDLSATLNPFVAYSREAPRRMFEAGSEEVRTVQIRVPAGPIEFGYAVDGCWQVVDGEVIDPVEDFPPDANCLEAYGFDVRMAAKLEPIPGSSSPVEVKVSDHQGLDTIAAVTLEAPDLFQGVVELAFSGVMGEESFLFEGAVSNDLGADFGVYPMLVRVVGTEADQNFGPIDGWHVVSVSIGRGWARAWGGDIYDEGTDVAADSLGNAYVTGYFHSTVDFDPGADTDEHSSNGGHDVFLSKFGPEGEFQWALTWGGPGTDFGRSVAVSSLGDVLVVGRFTDTVDLDPGAGIEEHTSSGGFDVFLSKFDSSGILQWAVAWGGEEDDYASDLAIDDLGNLYVAGSFTGTTDFDPGTGIEEHTSNGETDVFLSKFDASGTHEWTFTWGGAESDFSRGVAADHSGSVYVTGRFRETVDFDPTPGIDEHVSNGHDDIFLSKLDSTGSYHWARTWGSDVMAGGEDNGESGLGVAVDSSGSVYVAGNFFDTVDFDPGPGIEERVSNGGDDAFLSKFDSSGTFQWVRAWGGEHSFEKGRDVAFDDLGNVYVPASFRETVDFDPGPGAYERTSNGAHDASLSKFDPSGAFQWACTWGGTASDSPNRIAVDGFGSAYVTGYFHGIADFDPGLGTCYFKSNGGKDAYLSKFPPDGHW